LGRRPGTRPLPTATSTSSWTTTRTAAFSLIELVGIKLFLEEKLGIEADVTTRGGLHPMLKGKIERSAVRIF